MDAQGNVAYQQTPCPVAKEKLKEKPEATELPEATKSPEATELPEATESPEQLEGLAVQDIEACKEPLRDAIDEIEAEMLRGFSAQQGEDFKAKLRTLTQEMRACG